MFCDDFAIRSSPLETMLGPTLVSLSPQKSASTAVYVRGRAIGASASPAAVASELRRQRAGLEGQSAPALDVV